ncbi:MAG: dipeptidase [Planctomycetia bacterium]|nr:dipeptidase [Planctomycetia bacterium]
MSDLETWFEKNRTQCEADLFELLRIKSVSADSQFRPEIRRAANWVLGQFTRLGFAAELIETAGHPLVFAQSPAVPGAPTALVYGHYDVQPPDPLGEWISPPFEPTVRDGNVYARGATDDKGQMLTHVKATQAWVETQGGPPINLKFLIEGEEEVGSEHLTGYVAEHREKLACDCVVISDSSQFAPGQPAITYGLRGIMYFELRLTGPRQDLHSGTFGGGVTNPANALSRILAALVDDRGRIRVPGFYDDVVPLTEQERAGFAKLDFDEAAFCRGLDVSETTGEVGFTNLERRWARPTCDINGLWSGYQGEGAKTVLPARAGAKFSFRLVPNQDPKKIAVALRKYLDSLCPLGIKMELIDMHGAGGVLVPLDSPYIAAATRAIERGFGNAPVYIREGGSIPIVTTFREQLKCDTLLLGWGLNDDNTHSPNEKFCLADFHRGIRASAYLWDELARI